MRNPRALWSLWKTSQAFGARPSFVLGVDPEDTWLCFQVDLAVARLGEHVEMRLRELDEGEVLVVDDLFKHEDEEAKAASRFRSAAHLVTRKVKVNERGIW